MPNRIEFEEYIRSHWIAKNTIISTEGNDKPNEAEINLKMVFNFRNSSKIKKIFFLINLLFLIIISLKQFFSLTQFIYWLVLSQIKL